MQPDHAFENANLNHVHVAGAEDIHGQRRGAGLSKPRKRGQDLSAVIVSAVIARHREGVLVDIKPIRHGRKTGEDGRGLRNQTRVPCQRHVGLQRLPDAAQGARADGRHGERRHEISHACAIGHCGLGKPPVALVPVDEPRRVGQLCLGGADTCCKPGARLAQAR